LLKTHSEKPQVHFLAGQLRQARGEMANAYEHFKKAVELDAGYLDAWEKLYGMSSALFLSKKETEEMGPNRSETRSNATSLFLQCK
jgi:hypothetical protein